MIPLPPPKRADSARVLRKKSASAGSRKVWLPQEQGARRFSESRPREFPWASAGLVEEVDARERVSAAQSAAAILPRYRDNPSALSTMPHTERFPRSFPVSAK